jgi:hypothetical protein
LKDGKMSVTAGKIDDVADPQPLAAPPSPPAPIDIELLTRLRRAWRSEHQLAQGLWRQLQDMNTEVVRRAAIAAARRRDMVYLPEGFTPPPGATRADLAAMANDRANARQEQRQRVLDQLRQQHGGNSVAISEALLQWEAQMRPSAADYAAALADAEAALTRAQAEERQLIEDQGRHAALAGSLRQTLHEAKAWLAAHHPHLAEAA